MTRLTLDLPDELQQKLCERAAETGAASVEAYVEQLLRADADGVDPGSAASVQSQEQLESLLVSRLDDPRPSIEPDAQFWERLRRRASGEQGEQS